MVREDYKNWLKEADWDLETAEILKEKERYNTSAFYAQQAVEKLLKSALMFKNESPWGHSTRELLIRLDEIVDLDLSELKHFTLELDHHYIPSRYPNAHPNSAPHEVYDEIMADNALNNAKKIFQVIRTIFDTKKSHIDSEANLNNNEDTK
jgi:HEPN domain-containing protein